MSRSGGGPVHEWGGSGRRLPRGSSPRGRSACWWPDPGRSYLGPLDRYPPGGGTRVRSDGGRPPVGTDQARSAIGPARKGRCPFRRTRASVRFDVRLVKRPLTHDCLPVHRQAPAWTKTLLRSNSAAQRRSPGSFRTCWSTKSPLWPPPGRSSIVQRDRAAVCTQERDGGIFGLGIEGFYVTCPLFVTGPLFRLDMRPSGSVGYLSRAASRNLGSCRRRVALGRSNCKI